jgi:hypothetical protein
MSEKFDLAEIAKNLAATAKDAMRIEGEPEPDDVSWGLAQQVLDRSKKILPNDIIVQRVNLERKLWVSVRSAMEAVAVKLDSQGHQDVVDTVNRANEQARRNLRGGY